MRLAASPTRRFVAVALLAAFSATSTSSLQSNLATPAASISPSGQVDVIASLSLLQVAAQFRPSRSFATAQGVSTRSGRRGSKSSLHDVVGDDGVLMIHLNRAQDRANYTLDLLAKAGIFPRKIPGTDAESASEDVLEQACPLNRGPDPKAFCKSSVHRDKHSSDYRPGGGCKDKTEQAITDSHHQALLLAAERQEEWTAIFEDDAVPVRPETWSESFREAWQSVPETARLIRLGWCTFRAPQGKKGRLPSIFTSVRGPRDGNFEMIDWMSWGGWGYRVGGCTTAYIVHRSIIPEMLGIFPCCCAMDCCLEYGLFYQPATHATPGLTRGMEIMMSMDAEGSTNYSATLSPLEQSGVMVQDNRKIDSLREKVSRQP